MLDEWIDLTVEKKWGPKTANRVRNIAYDGSDYDEKTGEDIDLFKLLGFASRFAGNVYHISQVLGWLAKDPEAINVQLERLGQIHALIEALLKDIKR